MLDTALLALVHLALGDAAVEGEVAVAGETGGGVGEDFAGAYELVASGRVRPVIDTVLPLEEIRAAHERLEAGEQLGKIVLSI